MKLQKIMYHTILRDTVMILMSAILSFLVCVNSVKEPKANLCTNNL